MDKRHVTSLRNVVWGNILPIKCDDYHFDETLLLLRNYFALRGGNGFKLTDKVVKDINATLEEKWNNACSETSEENEGDDEAHLSLKKS